MSLNTFSFLALLIMFVLLTLTFSTGVNAHPSLSGNSKGELIEHKNEGGDHVHVYREGGATIGTTLSYTNIKAFLDLNGNPATVNTPPDQMVLDIHAKIRNPNPPNPVPPNDNGPQQQDDLQLRDDERIGDERSPGQPIGGIVRPPDIAITTVVYDEDRQILLVTFRNNTINRFVNLSGWYLELQSSSGASKLKSRIPLTISGGTQITYQKSRYEEYPDTIWALGSSQFVQQTDLRKADFDAAMRFDFVRAGGYANTDILRLLYTDGVTEVSRYTQSPSILLPPIYITEYMLRDWSGIGGLPQWLEFYNPNGVEVSLKGYTFQYVTKKFANSEPQYHTITIGDFSIPAQSAVIFVTKKTRIHDGITEDQVYNLDTGNVLKRGWLFTDTAGNDVHRVGTLFSNTEYPSLGNPWKPAHQDRARVSYRTPGSGDPAEDIYYGHRRDIGDPGHHDAAAASPSMIVPKRVQTTMWSLLKI